MNEGGKTKLMTVFRSFSKLYGSKKIRRIKTQNISIIETAITSFMNVMDTLYQWN